MTGDRSQSSSLRADMITVNREYISSIDLTARHQPQAKPSQSDDMDPGESPGPSTRSQQHNIIQENPYVRDDIL